MWIIHPATGMPVCVTHEAHIKRLLEEGGREVDAPSVEQKSMEPLHDAHDAHDAPALQGVTSVKIVPRRAKSA
jgi:hypothetical protein